MDNLTARTLLNSAEEKRPLQNISGLSNVTRLRAGSHYRQFCRKLFAQEAKICQHISFRMRPLICDFSKIPKSGKTSETPVCLDGADLFFQISKNQRSPLPKLSTVERNDSQYWRQSHEPGKEREVHHSHWRFHRVRFEATAWTSEIFPFLTTAI